MAKKLIELGLDEEKVLRIIESHQKRIERAKKYQREKYFKVSVAVKRDRVREIMNQRGVDENVAKKIAVYEKLKAELSGYV